MATPNYNELNELHTNLFKSFGALKHHLDIDMHPELDREAIAVLVAELQGTAMAMVKPMVALLHDEVRNNVREEMDAEKYDGVPADTGSV